MHNQKINKNHWTEWKYCDEMKKLESVTIQKKTGICNSASVLVLSLGGAVVNKPQALEARSLSTECDHVLSYEEYHFCAARPIHLKLTRAVAWRGSLSAGCRADRRGRRTGHIGAPEARSGIGGAR